MRATSSVKCRICDFEYSKPRISCPRCLAVQWTADVGAVEKNYSTHKSANNRLETYGVVSLASIQSDSVQRIQCGFGDRLWGPAAKPGIANTSVTLFGGAPGFGKSTFCLQLASAVAKATNRKTLYIGAEESGEQVRDRATRLKIDNLEDLLILPIEAQSRGHGLTPEMLEYYDPSLVIIDSAQKYSDSQDEAVRIAETVKTTAVVRRCPFVIICQVTKDLEFEGSNKLKHACDTLLMGSTEDELDTRSGFVGPPGREPFRVVEVVKNRFGPQNELVYTMHEDGLRLFDVDDFLEKRGVDGDNDDDDDDDDDDE